MYIDTVPNRHSPPAILLREGWREGRKTRKRTLANLSHWPARKVETLRRLLRDDGLVSPTDLFQTERTRSHGHVQAVLGTVRQIGLDRIIASQRRASGRRRRWPKNCRWRGRTKTICTTRWTGCWLARIRSSGSWRIGI